MAVKSVFDIKCFKDVKFWVEQSVFTLRYKGIRKHFLKYHSIPNHPNQDRHSFGLHLGSNCLQRLLADDKIIHWHAKS